METIAVYWEAKIKTYGFTLFRGQVIVRVRLPAERLGDCGLLLEELAQSFSSFRTTSMSMGAEGNPEMGFLFDRESGERFLQRLERQAEEYPDMRVSISPPLDAITFYGPHFQDRFGIAHAACGALAVEGLAPQVTVCSGSTAWMVLPDGTGDGAMAALRRAFCIPGEEE